MQTSFNLQKLTDEDKEKLRSFKATFVMAPREMSEECFRKLVKDMLSKGNIICGVAEEDYVEGYEDQPQFKMIDSSVVSGLASTVAKAHLPHGLYVFTYPQKQLDEVIRAIRPNDVVVVRGSYKYPFHRKSTFDLLKRRNIPFRYVSPFSSEEDAKNYLRRIEPSLPEPEKGIKGDEASMLMFVDKIAKRSFDYSFQVGAALADHDGDYYTLVDAAANEVVPYQTYALHHGNSRETHLSAHQDANHYDTIHAEMNLLVRGMSEGYDFKDKTLFLNMMPCPNCARTLSRSGLKEVVYREVHSGGYAVELFKKSGINIRRVES